VLEGRWPRRGERDKNHRRLRRTGTTDASATTEDFVEASRLQSTVSAQITLLTTATLDG